jgi:hypothetical protein
MRLEIVFREPYPALTATALLTGEGTSTPTAIVRNVNLSQIGQTYALVLIHLRALAYWYRYQNVPALLPHVSFGDHERIVVSLLVFAGCC